MRKKLPWSRRHVTSFFFFFLLLPLSLSTFCMPWFSSSGVCSHVLERLGLLRLAARVSFVFAPSQESKGHLDRKDPETVASFLREQADRLDKTQVGRIVSRGGCNTGAVLPSHFVVIVVAVSRSDVFCFSCQCSCVRVSIGS